MWAPLGLGLSGVSGFFNLYALEKFMNTNQKSAAGRHQATKTTYETFQLIPVNKGWRIQPANRQSCELLSKLLSAKTDSDLTESLAEVYSWPSLTEATRLISEIARDRGIAVRYCGALKTAPFVQLWSRDCADIEEVLRPFECVTGDAAVWSVSDFREGAAEALQAALASKQAFDTGWYSVKKEIQSARIYRANLRGPIFIDVSAGMDEWPELVDSATWEAGGKLSSDGFSTLTSRGLTHQEAQQWLSATLNQACAYSELGGDCTVNESGKIPWNSSFGKISEKLEELLKRCNTLLEAEYARIVELCKENLEQL